MIIDSGRFNMESQREFTSKYSQQTTSRTGNISVSDLYGDESAASGTIGGGFLAKLAYAAYGKDGADTDTKVSALDKTNQIGQSVPTIDSMYDKLQFKSLNYLFNIFFGEKSMFRNSIWGSGFNMGMRYQSYTFTQTYEESESTRFETTGTVKTADGREINFNLNVEMSRSFYEETNASFIKAANPLIDPLVINLDGNVDAIADQTFYFDLDCDGEKEEISNLMQGSAFLALDKNEDGQINDGSELFGALSGDGFAELAQYDMDGNGWIDEADEIFERLRVWSIDAEGNGRMYSLKESDIGAICLASMPTQFSVNNENNDTRAVVRNTGFFLRESDGAAGSVQQIDLAAM